MGNTAEISIASKGRILLAAFGAAELPTDIEDELDQVLVDAGYVTDAGVKFKGTKERKGLGAWGVEDDVLSWIAKRSNAFMFQLEQSNGPNLQLALGGGTVTSTDNGNRFDWPAANEQLEFVLLIEAEDADSKTWYCIPKCVPDDNTEWDLSDQDPTLFAITMKALGGTDLGIYRLSNNPAFDPVSPS